MEKIRKALLIEDDAMAQHIPKSIFEENGWRLDIKENGQAALAAIAKEKYDLILMDVGLPDIHGFKLGKVIHALLQDQHIPLIGLSARIENIRELEGVSELILKPFTVEIFNKIIEKYIKKRN